MLKRMTIKKILISSTTLLALFLIYLIPKENDYHLKDLTQKLEYVNTNVQTAEIFLLGKTKYLTKVSVPVSTENKQTEKRALEVLEYLKIDSKYESKIPSGFQSYLPSDTKVNSVKYEEGILKIDFSKEVLNVKENMEEKTIEGIVYSLTAIENVKSVILYSEGAIITKLPQTGIILPSTLDRSIGINKEYHISSYKDVNKVTVYYMSAFNDEVYYVPVTKYVNDNRDKISIIIEQLSGSSNIGTNLMSYLNSNTRLMSYNQVDDTLNLVFNSYIFEDVSEKSILEEVIYTISLSVADNYDVKKVSFSVDNEEIYKSVLKSIENG